MENVDIRDLNEMERSAFLEAILESGGDTIVRAMMSKLFQSQVEFLNWAQGTADGVYPITMPDGSIVNIPSPIKIVEDSIHESEAEDPGDFAQMFKENLV